MSGLSHKNAELGPMSTRMVDGRTTLAAIVRSSTVELFQVFDIAVAPIVTVKALPQNLDRQLSAAASFTSSVLSGVLAMFVPADIHTHAKHPASRSYEPRDWTREVCNQLAGRIKNRLHGCDIDLRTGLPTSVTGTLLDRHRSGKPPEAMFGFRTLRGEVTVTMTGQIDFSRIVYTGNHGAAKEGDVILF